MHHQVQIMAAAEEIIGRLVGIGEVEVVGPDRFFARTLGPLIFAAEHMDMGRHMVHMAGVRAHLAEEVGRAHGALRHR